MQPVSETRSSAICKCGQPARPEQRDCWICHAAAMRRWRASNPLAGEARDKANCRSYTNVYIRRGKLIPQPCQFQGCREKLVQPHHDDYSKPLSVTWLCRAHHLFLEGKTLRKSVISRPPRATSQAGVLVRADESTRLAPIAG